MICNDLIFVSIASYRDPEVIHTLKSLIDNADDCSKLRIVVFEQNDKTDKSVASSEIIKVINTHYSNAKGPVWARYIIQQEYRDEEYYLQIDSHTRVIKHWDTLIKHQLSLLPNKSVLTNYLSEYNITTGELDNKLRSGLYIQGFGPLDGFTRIQSDFTDDIRYFPFTCRAWSACFSFSKADIIKDAPYDPALKFIFFGEELDITLRLFTRGWNFYAPYKNIFYTYFNREYRKTFWEIKDTQKIKDESTKYLNSRIYDKTSGKYCLGTIRSIKEYMDFADVESFKDKKLKKNAKAFRIHTDRVLLK